MTVLVGLGEVGADEQQTRGVDRVSSETRHGGPVRAPIMDDLVGRLAGSGNLASNGI